MLVTLVSLQSLLLSSLRFHPVCLMRVNLPLFGGYIGYLLSLPQGVYAQLLYR